MTTGTIATALGERDGGRRFRTRADAFHVRHGDGVWLRNDTGSFSIRGASAYDLVAALFLRLDGEQTLDEVCAGLPAGARRSVLRLVETLWRNGFVREVTAPPEVPPSWMSELYPAHLMYLDHHADRPVTRLQRVRSQRVAVVGEGLALRGVVGALGEFGVAELTVLTSTAGAAGVADLVARFGAADPRLAWRTVDTGPGLDLDGVVARAATTARHILLAADTEPADWLADLQERLGGAGVEVGVLGRVGDFVVAAPAAPAGPDGGPAWCWDCVRLSVAGRAAGDPTGLGPAIVPTTMAALHLVQHLFDRLADLDRPADPPVVSVEPLAPVSRTHIGRWHPACGRHPARRVVPRPLPDPGDGPVRPDLPAAQDPVDIVAAADRIVALTTAWTDPVVGPLLRVGEEDHDQLPLAMSVCRLADPAPLPGDPAVREVRCRAVSPREARNQVVLVAHGWAATRVARLRGGLPAGHVVAAGWTHAEAAYRAWLLAAAADAGAGPRAAVLGEAGPLRAFLLGSLAAAGHECRSTTVEDLRTGLVRATISTIGGGTATAVGLDDEHAVCAALQQVLAAVLPGPAALALLAPPVPTWAAALDRLTVDRAAALDVGGLLPHLAGGAALVAVPVPGAAL